MTSLLDQSALADLAERLVAAAQRAGADAADAIAVRWSRCRSMCATARSRNRSAPRATISGCASSSGASRRWFPPTISKADGLDALAERAVAMARAAPEDRFAGLADPALLAHKFPALDLLDPDMPGVDVLEARAQEAEAAGLAVAGVSKSGGASASAGIGGMVLVTSDRLSWRDHRFAPRHRDVGDRRQRHRHGDRLRLHLDAARRRSRKRGSDRPQRRRARREAAQPAQGRDAQACRSCSIRASRARWSAISPAPPMAARSRARPVSCARSLASRFWRAASTSSTIRCGSAAYARGHSMPKASAPACAKSSRTACSKPGCSTAPPRASSTWKPPATRSAASRRRRPPDRATCISRPAAKAPEQMIGEITDGFYVTSLIGMGVNVRDRRLQPRRLRVLDRERRMHLSGERGDDRRTSVGDVQRPRAGERPRRSATAPMRRRCAWRA